ESLGFSGPTGNIVPRHQEFALAIPPDPYDPKRAKALLAEAGYPSGLDAGEFTPFPPYNSMGEAIANYLNAVGIRTRVRTMARARGGARGAPLRRGEQEAQGAVRRPPGARGQSLPPPRGIRHRARRALVRVHPRGGNTLRRPAPGDGPEEARGDVVPDPEDRT